MRSKKIIAELIICLLLMVLPVSASDYTLGIFGNANEDDTINMQDVTYTELIILEYKDRTDLADAKYDGEIDILDVTQIELIILGQEKEITILQYVGYDPKSEEIVTINKPIDGIVVLGTYGPEAIRVLNAADKIVGIDTGIAQKKEFYPEISKLPSVGKWNDPDIEVIISLMPDFVLTYENTPGIEVENKLKAANIPMVRLNFYSTIAPQSIEKLGYILGKKEQAEEYGDYVNEYFDIIESRVEGLTEDEKPKVFLESWSPYKTTAIEGTIGIACTMAGGKNIVTSDMDPGTGSSFSVDPEWVVEQNPDFFLKAVSSDDLGYATTDISKVIEERNEIIGRPELANVAAVKKGKVYLHGYETIYVRGFIGTIYMAKWFHPELFEDLDPVVINREYLERFQDIPCQGVYVYPPFGEN